ncbi:hypothetical protein BpHYR1_043402 [Brachionus plicatilis]|uniref:Uncharacterized protein n=1 Tax=Brachionus plicatilis TaxID=10195 RepID=A0A3M7RKI0_BRAPC|nr:hypothetical protein BpHYR1_043402 [Brachionus plicatilis]
MVKSIDFIPEEIRNYSKKKSKLSRLRSGHEFRNKIYEKTFELDPFKLKIFLNSFFHNKEIF